MNLYIVRHGESEGNVNRRHQTAIEPLTPKGRAQAKQLASRFARLPVTTIVASPMLRAQDTALEIAKVTKASIITNDAFKEILRPSKIEGKFHKDKESLRINQLMMDHSTDPDFHYSDEENYFDFIKRVATGLQELEQYGDQDNIVVVCHGHVIRVLFGLIVFGTEFSAREFELLMSRLQTRNTGITLCTFSPETRWQLHVYNDHSHLLDGGL